MQASTHHYMLPWQTDLAERALRHLALKVAGISAFMCVFFIGYFYTLRAPAYPVHLMPLTPLDGLIPFQPIMLWAYFSLWLYVGIAPGLVLTLRELLHYGLWAGALCLTGLMIFFFWPTTVPPHSLATDYHLGFSVLRGVDASGNACPSLHVATAVFTALWVARLLRLAHAPAMLHALNLIWVSTIAWSTVAIRQHVVLDVFSGAFLGMIFAASSMHASRELGCRREAVLGGPTVSSTP